MVNFVYILPQKVKNPTLRQDLHLGDLGRVQVEIIKFKATRLGRRGYVERNLGRTDGSSSGPVLHSLQYHTQHSP